MRYTKWRCSIFGTYSDCCVQQQPSNPFRFATTHTPRSQLGFGKCQFGFLIDKWKFKFSTNAIPKWALTVAAMHAMQKRLTACAYPTLNGRIAFTEPRCRQHGKRYRSILSNSGGGDWNFLLHRGKWMDVFGRMQRRIRNSNCIVTAITVNITKWEREKCGGRSSETKNTC